MQHALSRHTYAYDYTEGSAIFLLIAGLFLICTTIAVYAYAALG